MTRGTCFLRSDNQQLDGWFNLLKILILMDFFNENIYSEVIEVRRIRRRKEITKNYICKTNTSIV